MKKDPSKSWRYATYGALVSLTAPVGWALLDTSLDLDTNHPLLFYYLVLVTCTSFTLFSFFLGRKIEQIEKLSQSDQLTKLYNQMTFVQLSQKLADHCQRTAMPFTVMLMDVDWFKKINDKHGHLFGNAVLQFIADTIKTEVRSSDVLARFGGDEFALFLPSTTGERSIILAERIREKLRMRDYDITKRQPITLSIGISDSHDSGDTLDDLLQNADLALYESKKQGRDRTTLFSRR